jgi:hypothetical protein
MGACGSEVEGEAPGHRRVSRPGRRYGLHPGRGSVRAGCGRMAGVPPVLGSGASRVSRCSIGTFPRKRRLSVGSGLLCDMGRFRGNAVGGNARLLQTKACGREDTWTGGPYRFRPVGEIPAISGFSPPPSLDRLGAGRRYLCRRRRPGKAFRTWVGMRARRR